MPRFGLFVIILLMIAGLIGFFISTDLGTTTPVQTKLIKEPLTVTLVDPTIGPLTAKTTIIEFGDFTCPFCRDADIILKELASKYPTTIRLVWKDFPNDAHNPLSSTLSYAGRCAQGLGKFEMFRTWAFGSQGAVTHESLVDYLISLGVTSPNNCLADPSTKAKVTHTINQGNSLEIDGTPYILINNQPYNGPITLEALENIIKQ